MKKEAKYNIGLDIGTTSVGWAVVDTETNKLLRKGNKSLWGVRLFDEAISAKDTRNYRNTRRRYDRRRQRIKLLRQEFNDEINKVDPNFYTKLNEFFYNKNDVLNKTVKLTKEDKLIIHKYPTIYHLRKELITNLEKQDIRLVYLAIHHIIKYRGNFNHEGNLNVNNLSISNKLIELFSSLYDNCEELELSENIINDINYEKLEIILKKQSKNDIKLGIKEELENFIPKYTIQEFIKLISGYKFTINKLFNIELDKEYKISFNDSNFDEELNKVPLEEKKLETLNLFKELYEILYLKQIFKNQDSISISSYMINKYEKNGKDLEYLKKVLSYNEEISKKVFKNGKEKCLYSKYIHNKISYEEFSKELIKYLNIIIDYADESLKKQYKIETLPRIENNEFLPRLTETNNGIFPYQLNEQELIKIIENQGKYYPFLLNKIDNEYKLVKLLKFRIPYYVGPLNKNSKFAWIQKYNEFEKTSITPYNFDKIVDKEKSAYEFINRMLGNCTYLFQEKAMANNSIICSEFKVLNELKQIKVNNIKLTQDFIKRTISELFLKETKPITDKIFKEYLYQTGEYDMYKGNIEVKGYSADKKFANDMKSYIDFYGPNGFFKNTNYTKKQAEEIIRYITIFEDKEILKKKILSDYPDLSNRVDEIIKKNYKGWSNISEKLITEKYYLDKKTGIKKSILDLMYETDENFMQILNNNAYNFESMINEINSKTLNINNNKLNYNVVKELYTSPATRKGIWQSLLVVDEIVRYIGYSPSKISIEMSRGDEKKQRTLDRKKYLTNLYEKCKDSINEYNRLRHELDGLEKIDSERLYLYFIQLGRCLYTNTRLEIEKINSSDYEVDHIIPQCLIKDDSIENKALVLRDANQDKAANFVLPEKFRKNINNWEILKKMNLISSKKFYNLKRPEYSDKDIEGFINRQLVETRQITKHVANIFKNYYPESKVIYLPARLSHNYREKYELYKYRDLNDYHHAHDAYLAAILGEYKDKFKFNIDYDKLKEINKKLYDEHRYNEVKYGYVINSIDNEFVKYNDETGEIRFDADEFNKIVSNTLHQNDILISKKTEVKTGTFYKETIYSKNSINAKYNIKENLPVNIYGGYNSVNTSYMKLIKYYKKNKETVSLIGIPINLIYKNDNQLIDDYIKKSFCISNYEVLLEKIPYNIEIKYNNQLRIITGCGISSAELVNAIQFRLTKGEQIKYKYLLNFIFNDKYPYFSDKYRKKFITRDDFKEYFNNIFNEQINQLYDLYIVKLNKYYPSFQNIAIKLEQVKIDFYNLKLVKNDNKDNLSKIEVIKELFKITKFSSINADLSKFKSSVKFSDRIGRSSGNNIKSGTIINKSVTGIWEKHYEF